MDIDEYIKAARLEKFDHKLGELQERMQKQLPSFEEYMQCPEAERMIQANRILSTCAVETSREGGYYSLSAQIGTVDTDSIYDATEEGVVIFPVFEKNQRGRYSDRLWVLRRVKDPEFGYTSEPEDFGSIRFYFKNEWGNTEPPMLYVYEGGKKRDFDPVKDEAKISIIDAVVISTLEKRRLFLERGVGKKAVEST